ncbi:hypothetical protein ACFWHQ_22660 [Streptomyces sp. NPDC060334]|uniref:hypothetical protein n=1 Tax=Streptomyces sp. NPDC060334 TaxID=3347099 RepID=UPI003666DA09
MGADTGEREIGRYAVDEPGLATGLLPLGAAGAERPPDRSNLELMVHRVSSVSEMKDLLDGHRWGTGGDL